MITSGRYVKVAGTDYARIEKHKVPQQASNTLVPSSLHFPATTRPLSLHIARTRSRKGTTVCATRASQSFRKWLFIDTFAEQRRTFRASLLHTVLMDCPLKFSLGTRSSPLQTANLSSIAVRTFSLQLSNNYPFVANGDRINY